MKKESTSPDFVKLEKDVLQFWQDEHCFERLVEKNKNGKVFRTLDGPITANYDMGMHHVWGRTLKDVILKYKAMRGYKAKFQNGFDAHGLPVELAVEKELGLNSKKEILNYGMDNFVEKCLQRVDKYSGIQTKQSIRLGQWMDWDNSYYTNTDNNILAIWAMLKKCDEHGWIGRSSKPMPWCSRCGTSLSEHEMHGSYKDVEHIAVFFKCPIQHTNLSILVWTTTPWTLSSNVAVAVNPDNTYLEVEVKSDTRHLIIGKEAKRVLKDDIVKVVREFKGSELVGKTYETCFNEVERQNFEHSIVAWEDVQATEGSGAVHIAPGCGVEDWELGKRLGLREICPIDESGVILDGFGVLSGHKTDEVRDIVFDELKKRGKLYYTHTIKHSYPICWRCKNELVYRLVDTWVIKVDELRPRLIKACDEVTWEPAYLKKRMLDWLTNMGDWNISRSRFYGVPLPIYPCTCGHTTVVGSKVELEKLSSVEEVEKVPHLHRPYIDDVKITCPHCGKKVSRIPEVGDCWLDAGITPFSTNEYFTNRAYFEENFPSEVVVEMREQIRLWFYSLLFMSVVLEGRAPYEKVIGYESVVQEDGSKFSKSGFMIRFDDYAEALGSDSARYLFASNPYTSDVRFGYNLGEEARRRMLGYWNAYTFFVTYASIDNPDVEHYEYNEKKLTATDKWLLQIVNNFITAATKYYDEFKPYLVIKEFEKLVDDVTNFYIRSNRRRFWKSDDKEDQLTAYWCLYQALKVMTIVMAPIIPFTTEHIWQNLVRSLESASAKSVMLADFATPLTTHDFSHFVDYTDIAKDVITLGGRLRSENNLKVKQPLREAYVVSSNPDVIRAVAIYQELIKDELNIKTIEITSSEEKFNDLYLAVNFKAAGAVLKGDVQKLKNILANASADDMAGYVSSFDKGSVCVEGLGDLDASLFTKQSKPKEDFIIAKDDKITVVLDITLTPELIEEGNVREVLRAIQILRKEADFAIDQRVDLAVSSTDENMSKLISKYQDKIMQEVLATSFASSLSNYDIQKEVEIANVNITIAMKGK